MPICKYHPQILRKVYRTTLFRGMVAHADCVLCFASHLAGES